MLRVEHFTSWADRARPPTIFWLSAFTFPTSFLTAVLQRSARLQKIPIDALNWEFVVQTEEEHAIKEAQPDGVYVRGIYLEGGSWDREHSCLQEPKLLELICPMPVIYFKTTVNPRRKSKKIYECPMYYYPTRAAIGPIVSFVIDVDLKTGEQTASFWIKRGTALLLSLPT